MKAAKSTLDLHAEFPILSEMAFFNHAGVAPISGRAAQALQEYARQAASRAYVGGGWYRRLSQIRRDVATLINARGGHEIAFVPNTSTGLAFVARGLKWSRRDNVVITGVEYPANRYPWEDISKLHGVDLVEVPQQQDGRIDLDDLIEAINMHTRIVAISHVQFASGYRTDLAEVAEAVHEAGGYLCVDGIQSVGLLPVDVQAMGIDFLAADGHKWLLGPEGAGFFYCHEELCEMLHPAIVGWMNMVDAEDFSNYRFEFQTDARRFEPGTPNIPGLLAMGASIELLLEVGIHNVWACVETLTKQLEEGLKDKGYIVYSPRKYARERSGIVIFEPGDGKPGPQQIVTDLEKQGVIIVMRNGRLRASPHFYNQPQQIERLIDALP